MLRIDQDLRGQLIRAQDGDIGAVSDCYFDGLLWVVRYLAVETSGGLPAAQVLLPPQAIEVRPDRVPLLITGVTMEQIRQSPPLGRARPVSREHEDRSGARFGWPAYRDPMAASELLDPPPLETAYTASRLHSARAVLGCTVRGLDGDIGHVADVLIDEASWSIRYLVLDARGWLPGRHVVLAPSWFSRINWITGRMKVDLYRDAVRTSPRFDRTGMVTDEYSSRLHDHYGSRVKALRKRVEVSAIPTAAVSVSESRDSAKS